MVAPPSPAHPLRLYKKEKLCSEIAIGQLFARGKGSDAMSALAFPIAAYWRVNTTRSVTCPRFLISVPKKKLRHAVDRVTMRRRIRESYRLSRHLIPADVPLDIAFVYVADSLKPSAPVRRSMEKMLKKIAASLAGETI